MHVKLHGETLSKIGISYDPTLRIHGLNGYIWKKKKGAIYKIYAVFSINDDEISADIEKTVCKKFHACMGHETFDLHPEVIFEFCRKQYLKRGFKESGIWKTEEDLA